MNKQTSQVEAVGPTAPAHLHLKRLGIDTYREHVIYMRSDCHICLSEGFAARSRVLVAVGDKSLLATLNVVRSDLLGKSEAGLSEAAWKALAAHEGDTVFVRHPEPVASEGLIRAKAYGQRLDADGYKSIVRDIASGAYSDIQLAACVTACAGDRLDVSETAALTAAMIGVGDRLSWPYPIVADKHSVGGLPGNRTTMIVVPIVASLGLPIPKTSSRAITSPAGTADTMETVAPVDLDLKSMRRVIEKEGACIVWGGTVQLSPADDILIQVERPLDFDSDGQLVASVLSKKAAAGATHLVIDMPIGPTAKVRTQSAADRLSERLMRVGETLGLKIRVMHTDGSQPVGRGVGPALEARDVLKVLQNSADAPSDLAARAVLLAGSLIELTGKADPGTGVMVAKHALASGAAWSKFRSICAAQGGMREPPTAAHIRPVTATAAGRVASLDNRRLAKVAKLAGAPTSPAAGIDLHVQAGDMVEVGRPLFTVHAQSRGELDYALQYVAGQPGIIAVAQ